MAKFSTTFGVNKGVAPGSVELSSLTTEVKYGLMPVGTVIPVMTNIAGAIAAPATGTVVDGLMLCDGAVIPGGQTLSGNVPDLSDDRFLMGSASSGVTGGSNVLLDHTHTDTLEAPAHTHSINHDHDPSSTGNQSVNHDHLMVFSRVGIDAGGGGTTWEVLLDRSTYPGQPTRSESTGTQSANHTHSFNMPAYSGTSGGASATALTGSVGTGSAPSSTDSRPQYVTVQYMIRVK